MIRGHRRLIAQRRDHAGLAQELKTGDRAGLPSKSGHVNEFASQTSIHDVIRRSVSALAHNAFANIILRTANSGPICAVQSAWRDLRGRGRRRGDSFGDTALTSPDRQRWHGGGPLDVSRWRDSALRLMTISSKVHGFQDTVNSSRDNES